MFDRKAYMKEYYEKRYKKRKEEGRCTACGIKLTEECTTFLCEPCRAKQKKRKKESFINQKRKLFAELKKKYTEERE